MRQQLGHHQEPVGVREEFGFVAGERVVLPQRVRRVPVVETGRLEQRLLTDRVDDVVAGRADCGVTIRVRVCQQFAVLEQSEIQSPRVDTDRVESVERRRRHRESLLDVGEQVGNVPDVSAVPLDGVVVESMHFGDGHPVRLDFAGEHGATVRADIDCEVFHAVLLGSVYPSDLSVSRTNSLDSPKRFANPIIVRVFSTVKRIHYPSWGPYSAI